MKLKSSFQLFQVPETGNKKLDAANKIVFGIAKILLGDLITKGGIGGGAAIAGGTSGAGTVVGAGVAIAGVAIGSAVTADGLVNIAEGTLSLMQSNRNKSSNKEETASEQMAISMRRQIERDLGQNAGRDFHEMKDGPDRMPQQLKEDVAAIYEDYGKGELLPKWMTPE
jgi:hypothetical protein